MALLTDAAGNRDPHRVLLIRPRPRWLLSGSRVAWLISHVLLPLIVVVAFLAVIRTGLFPSLLMILLVLLVLGPRLLAAMNCRLLVTQSEVCYTNTLRLSRTFLRHDVSQFLRVEVRSAAARPLVQYLLIDSSGSVKLSLSDRIWSVADLGRMVEMLKVPLVDGKAPLSRQEADRQYPNWASFGLRHITAVTVAYIAVALGVSGLIAALVK